MINDNPHTPATGRVEGHRVQARGMAAVCQGAVDYSPARSIWFTMMLLGAVMGGVATATPSAVALFVISTAIVLLFGHSLGSHRKLIHNSYQCPRWLAYLFVYCGTLVGLSGPISLLRQHELRDYAQRLPRCHDYLRHGSGFCRDAWWQLHCDLHLEAPPEIHIEAAVANDSSTASSNAPGCCSSCHGCWGSLSGADGASFSGACVRA